MAIGEYAIQDEYHNRAIRFGIPDLEKYLQQDNRLRQSQ